MKDYSKFRYIGVHVPGSLELRSDRDHRLVLSASYDFSISPVLTVELYTKWYELYLLAKRPVGQGNDHGTWLSLYAVSFEHLDQNDVRPPGVSAYLDHAPNPQCVRIFTRQNDFHLDELAEELIIGRWQREYVDANVYECSTCEGKARLPVFMPRTGETAMLLCRECNGQGFTKPGA